MNKKTLRQLKLMTILPTGPARAGTRKLVDALQAAGFEATVRTVQRDLAELSESFPIACDDGNPAGWYWVERTDRFVPFGVDPLTSALILHVTSATPLELPTFLKEQADRQRPRAEEMIRCCGSDRLRQWLVDSRL